MEHSSTPSTAGSSASNYQMLPREKMDDVEMAYLSLILVLGTILNVSVFSQLIRQSRTPTAHTSFLTGPYQISSFTLFKLNLCITDFLILLIHAAGKVVWLHTYAWKFGNFGCKFYQFISAFAFYSNSNIVVAIGLDRLKVVYTSHIQGATSVRRVRVMVCFAWLLAAMSSVPQVLTWEITDVPGFIQCASIWEISQHLNATTAESMQMQMYYELFHQAMVFWVPLVILAVSYLLIVLRLVHYTFRSPLVRVPRSSTSSSQRQGTFADQTFLLTSTDIVHKSSVPKRSLKKPSNALSIAQTSFVEMRLLSIDSGHDQSSGHVAQRRSKWTQFCLPFSLTPGPSQAMIVPLPVWRRQLRSRVFITALAVVVAHIAMWLPYNLISTWRFIDYEQFVWLYEHNGHLLEDLIVLNSVINPILYTYKCR